VSEVVSAQKQGPTTSKIWGQRPGNLENIRGFNQKTWMLNAGNLLYSKGSAMDLAQIQRKTQDVVNQKNVAFSGTQLHSPSVASK